MPLKTVPARIEALSKEIRRLEHLLADPDFYTVTATSFSAAGAELARPKPSPPRRRRNGWARIRREEVQGA